MGIRKLVSKAIKWLVRNKGCAAPWCGCEIEGHYVIRNYVVGVSCEKHRKFLGKVLTELFLKKGIEVEFVKEGENSEEEKETEIEPGENGISDGITGPQGTGGNSENSTKLGR